MVFRTKLQFCLLLILITGNFFLGAQTLKGIITDSLQNPIPFVNVIVKDSNNQSILKFTSSDLKGFYQVSLNRKGVYVIDYNLLSYKSYSISIDVSDEVIIQDVVLLSKITELNEVIVQAERPIIVKKDTIIFKASAFLNGNETVVEDLLKQIPGLTVSPDGTIKVGNQEISKVMIEGDDFFDKGYKLLTKNLNADVVDKVELYQKYSNNKLLKDIEDSNKIALNLILKEDRKIDWIGNLSIMHDITGESRYETRGNLMRFGKKTKHYFLTNLNSIGKNIGAQERYVVNVSDLSGVGTIGDMEESNELIFLDGFNLQLSEKRYNFNNNELTSLNSIFNLTNKIKLKTSALFNWDENQFIQSNIQNFAINDLNFINIESSNLFKKVFRGEGKLDFDIDINNKTSLEVDLVYQNGRKNINTNLNFNELAINEILSQNNERFDTKSILTHKLSKTKVLVASARYIFEEKPQTYSADNFFFQDLFPDSNATAIAQNSSNIMQFAGFETHFLNRDQNNNLFEAKVGYTFREDRLKTQFSTIEEDNSIFKPSEYGNNLLYSTGDFYATTKYKANFKSLSVIVNLDFHQLLNNFNSNNINERNSSFYINPSLSLGYKFNDNNKISLRFQNNLTNTRLINVFENFVLTNYRGFNKGLGNFDQVNASSWSLNYALGKWTNKFFANFSAMYIKNHDFFSTNSIVTQSYSQTNTIVVKDREMLMLNGTTDRYFEFLQSNLKILVNYTKSNFKNSVNNEELREVNSNNYSYGFELRSAFDGLFNYHTGIKWDTFLIETTTRFKNTNSTSFLDVNFNFSDQLNSSLKTEHFYFGNLDTNNSYTFIDFETKYKFKKRDITLTLAGKNLMNNRSFNEVFISDINTSVQSYRILPRFILLGLDFRF